MNRNLPTMVSDAFNTDQDAWVGTFVSFISFMLRLERDAVGDHIQRETKRQWAIKWRWLLGVRLLALAAIGAGWVAMQQRSLALAN